MMDDLHCWEMIFSQDTSDKKQPTLVKQKTWLAFINTFLLKSSIVKKLYTLSGSIFHTDLQKLKIRLGILVGNRT